MNSKEIILKYLSDLMDAEEKERFEKSLKSDKSLKEEYEKITGKLSSFTNESGIEPDSAYFTNLIPKVKNKLDEPKKRKFFKFAPALSFGIAVLMLFFLNLPNSMQLNNNSILSDEFSQIISEADSTELKELLEENFFANYSFYHSGDYAQFISEESSVIDYYTENLDAADNYYPYESTIEDLDQFSEEEVDLIYQELINKKIL